MFSWFQGLPNKQTPKFWWILLLLDSKMIKKFINRSNCAAGAKKKYSKDARQVDWTTENTSICIFYTYCMLYHLIQSWSSIPASSTHRGPAVFTVLILYYFTWGTCHPQILVSAEVLWVNPLWHWGTTVFPFPALRL